jgi:hypothetical protein
MRWFQAALGVALICMPAFGQPVVGAIAGTVLDPAGGGIENARITATSEDRKLERRTLSGAGGHYRISSLPPGVYRLTVAADGFRSQTLEGLRLDVDGRVRQDFRLPIGEVRESITVRAPLKTLTAEGGAQGYVLDRERVAELPLNRRDFLQLGLLVPGVLPPVQDSELSSRGGFAMHASGGREEYNNFTLDGADNNDPYNNRYVLQPSVEAIREFKVLHNSYSAEYGRNPAAQVNVVTRSGGEHWHGALYNYLRNRSLDARNFFAADNPKYIRNQFGATAGGPLRPSGTYLFLNYEGLRERRGLTRLATVPLPEQRQGDFSALPQPVLDPFTRQPFPANRIPAARWEPLSARVLELYPHPNRPRAAGNFIAQPVLRDAADNVIARLDHRLTASDELTLRFGYGRQDLLEPYAEESTDVPGFGNFVDNTGHNASLGHSRVLGHSAVLTSRFVWGRSFRNARPENFQTNVGALWGVPWLNVRERDHGYPSIRVAGLSMVGDVDQLPLERTTVTWQWQSTLAWQRGRHGLKFGGEFRRFGAEGYLDFFARGSMTFSGALTGNGLADLLLGLPSFSIQSQFDNPQNLRSRAWYGFAQDDWRLARTLTLSLGVRYEFTRPPVDPADRMYVLDPRAGRLARVGTEGIPRAGIHPDRNNWAPRLGIAWNPAERWVLRSGYGVFYDSGMFVVNSALYFNPPLFNVRVWFPTSQALLTLRDPFPMAGGVTPPPSPNTLSPDITSGYLQHWNFSVERQLSASTTASLSYVGAKGTKLLRSRDPNQPRPGPGLVAARRPMPQFGGIFFTESGGNSSYHSLQAHLDRRLSRNISVLASYTWGKSIDDTSAFLPTRPDKNFPQDSLNYRAERGRSSYDIRQRFSLAGLMRSPWRGVVARDFHLRVIAVAQSGQAFTPALRFDNSNTGNSGGVFGQDRPDLIGDPQAQTRSPERWFNTTAFAIPAPFRFGNAGRNILSGPALVSLDAGLSRRFSLHELLGLTFDLQAFNLLNRANFDLPERFADEPASFGRIFSAKAPRQLQLAIRLEW